jgi:hypothetical protein
VTEVVVTVKLALVAPAGTVTLAGTVVALELSESDTAAPPPGAAAVKVTVPVEELPPTTLPGLRDSAESVGAGAAPALINKSACCPGLPCWVSKDIHVERRVRGAVLIAKVALVAPRTVTLAGMVATVRAPVWRAPRPSRRSEGAQRQVPVDPLPPTTLVGLTDTPESTGGGASPARSGSC